ncbi:hypothetical protein TNCV_1322441 [Trichonephila clavipes]|nr:hypothetical protein TNCV_1322441 [Trichonephila clavipes]
MHIIVKPFSRSSVVVEPKIFLTNFNLEKLLSPLATLIGNVSNILKTIPRFGAKSSAKTMEDPTQQCLTAAVQLEVSNAPWSYRSQFDPVAHGLDANFRLTKFSEMRG